MIKGCFGCVFDLIKISLGGLVIIIGINYFSSKNNLVTIKSCYDGDTCTTIKGEKIRLTNNINTELIDSLSNLKRDIESKTPPPETNPSS